MWFSMFYYCLQKINVGLWLLNNLSSLEVVDNLGVGIGIQLRDFQICFGQTGLLLNCSGTGLTRNVLDEEQLAEMVLAPEGWQVDKSTIPTGYMMHIMSVGNGVKATLCGREGLHIVNSLHRDVSKCKRLCDTGLCGDLHERNTVVLSSRLDHKPHFAYVCFNCIPNRGVSFQMISSLWTFSPVVGLDSCCYLGGQDWPTKALL